LPPRLVGTGPARAGLAEHIERPAQRVGPLALLVTATIVPDSMAAASGPRRGASAPSRLASWASRLFRVPTRWRVAVDTVTPRTATT
jgi:hypothetical protein